MNRKDGDLSVLYEIIISQLVVIPAVMLSGFISGFSELGKKMTIVFGFIMCSIVSVIPLVYNPALLVCSSIINFFIIFSFCSTKVYIIDSFPTKYKDYAISICYFTSKMGDAVSPIISDLVYKYYTYAPVGIITIISVIGIIISSILPVESREENIKSKDS